MTVAKQFIPDADMASAEVELTSALMNKILKKAGEAGTSATQLKRLNDIAGKLLAEQRVSADEAKSEIIPAIKNVLFGEDYKETDAKGKTTILNQLVGRIKIDGLDDPEKTFFQSVFHNFYKILSLLDDSLSFSCQIW